LKWILDNASWIFSGVGIVLFTGLGYLVKRVMNNNSNGQNQKVDRGSTAIQAGRDVKIGRSNDRGEP
jgi:hypothetical protein